MRYQISTSDMSHTPSIPALRAFVRVAATGSLSQAAAKLGLAQSAVSRYIAQLEAEFEGVLFYRTGRGVICTELGSALLESAQVAVDAVDALTVNARDQTSIPSGAVRVGILHGISGFFPSRLYADVGHRFPRIRLQITEGHSGEIEEWTTNGQVSIGILNRYRPGKWQGAQRLLTSSVCLVGRPGSFANATGSIGFRSMAGYPLVVPVTPNAMRARLEELAQRTGLKLNIAIEASGNTTVKSLVSNHGLFGIMPHHSCARELRDGTLQAVRIAERGLHANTLLVTSGHRPLTNAARAVVGVIPSLVRSLIKDGVWTESA